MPFRILRIPGSRAGRLSSPASLVALFTLLACTSALAADAPPAAAGSSAPSTLAIDDLGKGLAPLNGPWQFHLGDDPAFAAPSIDDATGHAGWEQLTADKTWGAQTHPAYAGFAWYRRHLHLSPAPGADADFAMLLRRVDDAYEIYWNGQQVGSFGRMPPSPVWYYRPPAQTFGLGVARDGVLSIRVWKAPLSSFDSDQLGGFFYPPVVGSPTAIAARKAELDYAWMRSQQYLFAITGLYAIVVLLGILFWLRDRSQRVVLWMCAYCFSLVSGVVLLSLRIPFHYDFGLGLFQPIYVLQDIGLWFMLLYLLKLDQHSRLVKITRFIAWVSIIGGSLDGFLVTVTSPQYVPAAQLLDAFLTAITTIIEPFPLILIAFGLRKRLDASRWLMASFAFLSTMFSVLRIAVQQGARFTHWTLAEKIDQPLFNVLGNNFTCQNIFRSLLLISIVYAVYRYSQEASLRQSALEQEFKSARELQQVLIPEELPALAGFKMTSAYRPAKEVGGDFFQIIPGDDGSTLVILGDVSGKGLKAAMAVSLIVGAVRSLAETTFSPSEILAGLNRRLYGRMADGFATCLAIRFDPDGVCEIASAGHPAPFLDDRELDLPGALPLGLVPNATYPETALKIAQGSHLSLYTDGLLEARAKSGELYGFDRLKVLFAAKPDAAQAADAAVFFGQDDDITVLTLTRLAHGEQSTTHLSVPALARA
jgi:Stage II sporulation protein E (SpoIIE)